MLYKALWEGPRGCETGSGAAYGSLVLRGGTGVAVDAGGSAVLPPFVSVDVFEPLPDSDLLGVTWLLAVAATRPAALISPEESAELSRVDESARGRVTLLDHLRRREAVFVADLENPAAFFTQELAFSGPGRLTILDRHFAQTYVVEARAIAWSDYCPNGEIIRIPPGTCYVCDCGRSSAT